MIRCLFVLLFLVISSESPPALNNIGYLGLGYNQFTGNPHDEGFDPGLTVPIFDISQYTKNSVTIDGNYSIPDGVDAHRASSCNSEFVSSEILDENDFSNILQHSFEANFTGVPFSANGMFQRIKERCRKKRDVFVDSISICEQYAARILMYDPPSFTSDFITAVDRLPIVYSRNNRVLFVDFLKIFGTHVVTKVWMGSKLIKTYGVSGTEFSELLGLGFDLKLAATIHAGQVVGKLGLKTSFERSQALQSYLEQHLVLEELVGTSENPPQEFLDKWLPVRLNEPAPVRYALTKISTFVGKERRDAVEKAISEFCRDIGGQCEPKESLPPPVPICPSVKFDLDRTKHTGSCTYGISVIQKDHPKLTCPEDYALTGVQLSTGKASGHLHFNIGCSTRFDISLEPGEWVSPVLVAPDITRDDIQSSLVTCPPGHHAIGVRFLRYCSFGSKSNMFASLQCSRSSQPIEHVFFSDWSSLPMPSSPLYTYLTCDNGGIVCGIEFKRENGGGLFHQSYRLRCCQIGPKCLMRHPVQDARSQIPLLMTTDDNLDISDPDHAEEEEDIFFSTRLPLDEAEPEFFSSRSLLNLGNVEFFSSRFCFDVNNDAIITECQESDTVFVQDPEGV